MNKPVVNADTKAYHHKLKVNEVVPVVVRNDTLSPLHDLVAHPTEDALRNWFGPSWRFAIAGTELENIVLAAELLSEF